MIHFVQEWLMFGHATPATDLPWWPLALATVLASAMILGRQTRD